MENQEHLFAEFIKILGKGKHGARPLTQDEAYRAMQMILTQQIEPVQLGAFLMLMRIKEETVPELVGFVQAAREFLIIPHAIDVDLDWSSYAGKRRHLPWFILSILLLAQNGIKVFMHGVNGQTEGRLYTEEVLNALGIKISHSFTETAEQLATHSFSYLPLQAICSPLYKMLELRSLFGLRSPVHTLVRLLNPLNAKYTIQGIFHPNYRAVHQQAAQLLGQMNMAVLKGEGGETERNPDMDCLVQSVVQGELQEEMWPALFSRRHLKAENLQPQQLLEVWQGTLEDEFANATIIGTAAIALKLLGKATTQQEAQQLASVYWAERNREQLIRSV